MTIRSRPSTDTYRVEHERIFGPPQKSTPKVKPKLCYYPDCILTPDHDAKSAHWVVPGSHREAHSAAD